ncbi:MAG: ABC transporter permease [Phycisphaerales bacterium]
MWNYIVRRTLYNIPVFLSIIFVVMLALRVNDPVQSQLGKNATERQVELLTKEMGLDRPFLVQYVTFLRDLVLIWKPVDEQSADSDSVWTRKVTRSWDQKLPVSEMILDAIPPSMAVTIPTLAITASIAICVGLISAFFRGRIIDKSLMFIAVIGMSISVLVYIIIGQYWGAYVMGDLVDGWPFQITVPAAAGATPWFFFNPSNWVAYCMLPVLINVTVALGYDTRFYRAVMVEESQKDYIRTARAKGASIKRVMFVHMLKNAMIPIITRIMISLPFIITGSILIEVYFGIPGMGRTLINAINAKDFPVIQTFTALFAALFILSNILTDVLYALADPRVRLS